MARKFVQSLRGAASQEAIWMTIEQMTAMVLSFLVGVAVIRYLGPGPAGALNYAGALSGLIYPLATLGLESVVIRKLASKDGNRGEIWQTAKILLLSATAIQTLIFSTIALTQPAASLQQIAVWSVAVGGLANVVSIQLWAFRADSNYRQLVKVRLVLMTLIQASRFTLIHLNSPFIAFAAVSAIDPLLMAIAVHYLAKLKLPNIATSLNYSARRAKEMLAESWPLILTGFAIMIYTRIDVIMLEHYLGVRAAGIYSAATRLSELWNFLPVIVAKAAFPKLVKLTEVAPKLYTSLHQKLLYSFGAIAIVIGMATQFGAKTFVHYLYGPALSESALPLTIHIWSAIPVFIGVMFGNSYQIMGFTKPLMWGCIAGCISNVALNILWIPSHGPSGAAAATAVSYFLSVIAPLIFSRRARHVAWGAVQYS